MSRSTRPPVPVVNREPSSRRGARWIVCFGATALALVAAGCGGDVESRMQEVRALQDVGQFTESIDELREILAMAPDLAEANYRLGSALVQTGDPSRAIWALKKASESPEFAVPAGLMLASAHFTVNDLEEAIRAANQVLEINPELLAALQLRAKANLGVHRLEDALADSERLIELAPDDYQNRAIYASVLWDLGRADEAEAAHEFLKEIGEASSDPALRPRACIAPAVFAEDFKKDLELAEARYRECIEKYPTDGFLINHVVGFLDGVEKAQAATDLVRDAVEAAPENLSLRSSLANRLRTHDDVEGAEAVLVEAAETFNSAAAWNLLATFYRRTQQSEKALGAVEKVIELTGGGGDELRFTQADVLIDLERYDEAEALVEKMDEPIFETLIRGRIQLAKGDPAAALASFDKGVRHWPNNSGARYLAGLAAYELGDWERAISELREALRTDQSRSDAAHMLARIYYEQKNYEEAVKYSSVAVRRSRDDHEPADYILATRALAQMGEFEKARNAADKLADLPGQRAAAVAEHAFVTRAESGPAAAVDQISRSGLDLTQGENADALRALVDNLLALDRADEALARIDRALANESDDADLHSMRGTVLARQRRMDDSAAAFEAALAIDAENASALAGLATLAGNQREYAKAVELFDRAEANSESPTGSYAYSAAQISVHRGDLQRTVVRLGTSVTLAAGEAGARAGVGWRLAEVGVDLVVGLELA